MLPTDIKADGTKKIPLLPFHWYRAISVDDIEHPVIVAGPYDSWLQIVRSRRPHEYAVYRDYSMREPGYCYYIELYPTRLGFQHEH